MAAEGAANGRGVDLHVVHRLEHMAHESETGTAQIMENERDGAPLANLLVRLRISLKHADHDI